MGRYRLGNVTRDFFQGWICKTAPGSVRVRAELGGNVAEAVELFPRQARHAFVYRSVEIGKLLKDLRAIDSSCFESGDHNRAALLDASLAPGWRLWVLIHRTGQSGSDLAGMAS